MTDPLGGSLFGLGFGLALCLRGTRLGARGTGTASASDSAPVTASSIECAAKSQWMAAISFNSLK